VTTLWQDIKYGARMLTRQPGVTTTAMLTLALGICANSTILSWINATILDPVPGVSRTGRLVTLQKGDRSESPVPPLSYLDFNDLRWRLRGRSFVDLLGYHDAWMAITESARPERVYGATVTGNYFTLLGARPALGRGFSAAEDGKPGGAPVIVIGDGLWRSRFGASPKVIGRTLHISGHPYTIVGVMPPGFQGCKTGLRVEAWIPVLMDREIWGGKRLSLRDTNFLNVVGRLAPGVSRQQAEADAEVEMQRVVRQYPDDHKGPNQITLDPLWRSPFGANAFLYASLPFLLGVAGVVLLLACANVANLMLVRSVARRREVAVRLAMGAGRWRLVRQFLVESLVLAMGGAVLSIVGTAWTAELFQSFIPPTGNPITLNGRLDAMVILATIGIAVTASAVAGILPALRSTSLSPVEVLNDEAGRLSGGMHRARLTRGLVVAQVSLSILLLVFAGLFVRSLDNASRADPGFDPSHVLLASVDLAPLGYAEKQGLEFQRQLVAALGATPGVVDAALADWIPLTFSKRTDQFEADGYIPRTNELMDLRRAFVSPGYFRTMKIPLARGREFAWEDSPKSERVAIVDEAFARRYWPGQEALGRRVRVRGEWWKVVGVARDSRHHRLNEGPDPMFYLPSAQTYRPALSIHVRVSGDPAASAAAVRSAVRTLDSNVPLFDVATLESRTRLATITERVAGTFIGAFGVIALLLAAVGIYGVLSYTARQRTRELGIRMALGAGRREVFGLIVGDGLRLTAVGMAIGITAAVGLSGLLRQRLYGIGEMDAVTYAMVVALLSVVAFAACAIPAWRAARAQPLDALRTE
jgi:predicted permease